MYSSSTRRTQEIEARIDDVVQWNQRLIYADLTGFGEKGPDADLPGFDITAYWARTGLMEVTHDAGSPPTLPIPGVGDQSDRIDAVFRHRNRSLSARTHRLRQPRLDLADFLESAMNHTAMNHTTGQSTRGSPRQGLTETLEAKLANPETSPEFDLRKAVNDVLGDVGLTVADGGGKLTFYGQDPIIASPFRFGSMAAIGLAAKSVAVAALWMHRTGEGQSVSVDVRKAMCKTASARGISWSLGTISLTRPMR
jgi:hypothetical protein